MADTRRWQRLSIIFGCWTVASIVYTSHLYFFHSIFGDRVTWGQELAEAAADFYTWAFLSPFIWSLATRFPLGRSTWSRSLLIHLPASLLLSLVQVALHTLADQILIHGHYSLPALRDGFSALFARTYHFGLLVYWTILGINHVLRYYRDRELAASQLETRLARAQLDALKMQLHPHFLFNTLHAISALMRQDVDAADAMIARLSDLLRVSLAAGNVQEVALQQEIEFLDSYLAIEKVRFQDRLTVRIEIAPETLDASVPNLILQPLVENAIRHGIAKRRGAGTVEIRSRRENGMLRLQVMDNGMGLAGAGRTPLKEGVGLSNTRARLEHLYGKDQRLELSNVAGGGLQVTLAIPFHLARHAASGRN